MQPIERKIIHPEVVAPLRYAMRLIDGKQADRHGLKKAKRARLS